MMCSQLFVQGDRLGGLNLYAGRPGAFDDSQDIGQMLAAHAAVAVAGAECEANLRTAVNNRDVIGQAKGILMERHELTADQAFAVLARVSQELNRKLADVARELTDTGAVPAATAATTDTPVGRPVGQLHGRSSGSRDPGSATARLALSHRPPSGRALLVLCQPGVVDRTCPAPTSGDEERRAAEGLVHEAPDDLASQTAHTSRAMTS